MVYSKYAGTELKVSGTEYVILKVRIVYKSAFDIAPDVGVRSHSGRSSWTLILSCFAAAPH